VWKWDQQEPFGNNVSNENPTGLGTFELPLRLPGQYFDKETNLHYNYFRDYDPVIGRYEKSDPMGLAGGISTYAYVAGSPLISIDPEGLVSTSDARSAANLADALAKTRGGIAGKKDCADKLSCDWLKGRVEHLDAEIHEKCKFLIPVTAWQGKDYLECKDSCSFWLKEKCKQPRSSCRPETNS
jgi:RHS repeat-associated protein